VNHLTSRNDETRLSIFVMSDVASRRLNLSFETVKSTGCVIYSDNTYASENPLVPFPVSSLTCISVLPVVDLRFNLTAATLHCSSSMLVVISIYDEQPRPPH
jgi:hypothetical protein